MKSSIFIKSSMKRNWNKKEKNIKYIEMSNETKLDKLGHNRQTANKDGEKQRMNNELMGVSLLVVFAHTTFDSLLLLQPLLFSGSIHPHTSYPPYFIMSVCSLSLLSPFSTSKRRFHCCSILPLSPVFCLSSLLFSHLLPHLPLLSSLPMASRCLNKVSVES